MNLLFLVQKVSLSLQEVPYLVLEIEAIEDEDFRKEVGGAGVVTMIECGVDFLKEISGEKCGLKNIKRCKERIMEGNFSFRDKKT